MAVAETREANCAETSTVDTNCSTYLLTDTNRVCPANTRDSQTVPAMIDVNTTEHGVTQFVGTL